MKCKQAEKLIINSQEMNASKKIELENHLKSCPNCSNFMKRFNSITNGSKRLTTIEPSDLLVQTTVEYCHSELSQKNQVVSIFVQSKIPTPTFIWAAIIAILTVSIIWFFPILKDFLQKNIIYDQTVWIFVIIIQNIIMLLFSPLIINKLKPKQHVYNQSYSI